MSPAPVLTAAQLEAFERWGVLRLPGLLAPDVVRRAREHVFDQLAGVGVSAAGGWRAPDGCAGPTISNGRISKDTLAEVVGKGHAAIAALGEEPHLLSIVDELLGHRPIDRTAYPHPQVLLTLPNAETWTSYSWHVDTPRLPSGQGFGVQLFGFLDTVLPGGGGTLAVAGSHRLLNDGRYMRMTEVGAVLRQVDFFRRLYSADPHERSGAMAQPCSVDAVEQMVVELTGEPGDAYLTDLRLLHAFAPNATDRPRVMVTQRFLRADLIQELTALQAARREAANQAAVSSP